MNGDTSLPWCATRVECTARNRQHEKTRIGVMKRVLALAALAEGATGAALLIAPSLVGRLLLGEELIGIAVTVARVAGIALIALAVACWPGPPLIGMLVYSAAVALYLGYAGLVGSLTGILLWPAIALHVVLTALLALTSKDAKATRT